MRPKSLNFEQLVKENKQELLNDENRIKQIELRLEKKHKNLLKKEEKELQS
ncbi:FbpB family small basic protein [Oceanobacillus bengalensis]|uniref:FbpB family small basic protein n=1 Tax=Oceanobacillus bengalensis TaxID=1435466 RepID=A0A494Z1G7_9BACI|nr:FbpB family small basic protein [Oceanobacillus bengalensis]RKQ16372.1 FbpB family small basic protein [Oceanobacillus bengalensis]